MKEERETENEVQPEERAGQMLTRVNPDPEQGLTGEQVQIRIDNGAVNRNPEVRAVRLRDIIRENVLTYFNLIFLIITVMLCIVGSYRNLTFLPVIVANTLIGIVQEWRSAKQLDRLKLMNAPKTMTVRDGLARELSCEELVLDDIVIFSAGSQIPADAVVIRGDVSVNESLLSGESDEIEKHAGDELLSGSFVVSGRCRARLQRVGEDSYISILSREAREKKKGEESEMIRSLNRLVLVIGILIIPISLLLFRQQYFVSGSSFRDSVTGTAAAVLGMIPEGLYLLASVALAVSAMRLAAGGVLVQNMKSVEALARVDVLCVDKTGTITENSMEVYQVIPLSGASPSAPEKETDGNNSEDPGVVTSLTTALEQELDQQISDVCACMAPDNITMRALKQFFTRPGGRRAERVFPFSPSQKYCGVAFGKLQLVLGAPEMLLPFSCDRYRSDLDFYASRGYRVLLFGEYPEEMDGKALQRDVIPRCFILLTNPVRENAAETFGYFRDQGVSIRVISGDNPMTVAEVALQAGIPGADRYVSVYGFSDEQLEEAAEKYTVFGRVSPQQKRVLIQAMKKAGHTVAMTGDGVNDVLALRDADCSIAMASGSDAAAAAAQMVLLDSDFARMPSVVTEGRRVVNNIERTASLFLVKNIFSLLMSIFTIVLHFNYPLEPSQISLIGMFTIGIPAFCMALETNRKRIRGYFLTNVMYTALPAGMTDFLIISGLVVFCREFRVSSTDLSTACTILLAIVGIMILYRIASPMTIFHWILWFGMIFGILFCMTFLDHVFAISMLSRKSAMLLILFAIVTEPTLRYLRLLTGKIWQGSRWIKKQWKEQKQKILQV